MLGQEHRADFFSKNACSFLFSFAISLLGGYLMSLSCPKLSNSVYKPRRPEKTVLYQVIKRYYKTWRRNAQNVPRYVDKEFNQYIGCGILSHGFACAHCYVCHQEFFLAFSCKGRGVCPSCNTKRMVEISAHLIENLIPAIPMRQWVISFPKRIRHFLQTDVILKAVLSVVADEIRKKVIACSPKIAGGQFGAVSFIQRFGSTLNLHPHFHVVVADGIFEQKENTFQFFPAYLTPDDFIDAQKSIRRRVLKLFGRRNWIPKDDVEKMLTYENSGFSLDAGVKIESFDRSGLERLIRYCARPCFAGENLHWSGPWLTYRLSKPTHTGIRSIQLDPLDFIDKIAAFIPPPRRHRHHYHGVFAPNSPMRKIIAKEAVRTPKFLVAPHVQETADEVAKVSLGWAKLIARIYEVNPLQCTSCGKEMKIKHIVIDKSKIWTILKKIGWPTERPEFDLPLEFPEVEICQLIPGTSDGFPDEYLKNESNSSFVSYHDPPYSDYADNGIDPPHEEVIADPPHWEDENFIIYR